MLIYFCIVEQNRITGLTSTVIPDLIPPCNALKPQTQLSFLHEMVYEKEKREIKAC